MRFDELDLSDDVLDALDAMNFEECTPIQEQAIDIVLEGRDLIAVAQTGTGKTAAYLLPVIDMLAGHNSDNAIKCVVMVPTHELAQQVDRQLEGFSYYLPISSVAIHGGTDGKEFARQQRGLKMGADVVIATPGRLIAHLRMGYVDLSKVEYFILDEADRMLDMGFNDDILQIARHLPQQRQTLMFSATMPDNIQRLAKTLLTDPAEVKIAVSRPTEKIQQSAFVCYEGQKTPILEHLFRTVHSKRVIVFASSKQKVKELSRTLRQHKWKAAEMHSDLDQTQRENVMLDFRAGRTDIVVATDILARGIDIDDISMVVNYDVPREAEDYVHRIGRTARANNEGKAVTFVGEKDQKKFKYIEDFLGYEVAKETMPDDLGEAPAYRPSRRGSGNDRHRGGKSGAQRKGGGNSDKGKRRKPAAAKPGTPKQDTGARQPAQTDSAATAENAPKAAGKSKRRYYHHRHKKSAGTAAEGPASGN